MLLDGVVEQNKMSLVTPHSFNQDLFIANKDYTFIFVTEWLVVDHMRWDTREFT